MSPLLYEFPLNEKCRSYLRLNDLFQQLQSCRALGSAGQAVALFKAQLDVLELLERCDLRTELAKDLSSQQARLEAWSQVPGVDVEALAQLSEQLARLSHALPRTPRLGQLLREDKFLTAIRSRFAIPGGLCAFDVPQLHYWLNLPLERQQQDIDGWLSHTQLLQDSLALLLTLWREAGQFRSQRAMTGFYQDNAEQTEMIRLRLPAELAVYPVVSGNKYRFTIRFMPVDDMEIGNLDFELANIK
ncbi:cell division protein ZapD [Zobellella aerophila]|uniref:Cell division protein ZapD n=1 Tax=Zobellella aerophila TaxID=870480 RepID=A0ABP6W6G6_9GAMM